MKKFNQIMLRRKWTSAPTTLIAPDLLEVYPVGDSITLGINVDNQLSGYRLPLQNLLTSYGFAFRFSGSAVDMTNTIPQRHHEGHGGWRIDQILSNISGWMSNQPIPHVVLLMIGTNDCIQNYNFSTVMSRMTSLLDAIHTAAPNAHVFVATVPHNTDVAYPGTEARVESFNAALPSVVSAQAASGRNVYLVDGFNTIGYADLCSDGIHPSQTGYDKLASMWLNAIRSVAAVGGTPPTNLVSNFSFESGLTGWSVGYPAVSYANDGLYNASEGTHTVAFNPGTAAVGGYVQQTITTVPGQLYELSFDIGMVRYASGITQSMNVRVTGSTTLVNVSPVILASASSTMEWFTRLYRFVADSTSTTIKFTDVSSATVNADMLLDNVVVYPVTS